MTALEGPTLSGYRRAKLACVTPQPRGQQCRHADGHNRDYSIADCCGRREPDMIEASATLMARRSKLTMNVPASNQRNQRNMFLEIESSLPAPVSVVGVTGRARFVPSRPFWLQRSKPSCSISTLDAITNKVVALDAARLSP
jgi:hypothetical protein